MPPQRSNPRASKEATAPSAQPPTRGSAKYASKVEHKPYTNPKSSASTKAPSKTAKQSGNSGSSIAKSLTTALSSSSTNQSINTYSITTKDLTKPHGVQGPSQWWIGGDGEYRGTARPSKSLDDKLITTALKSLARKPSSTIAITSPLTSSPTLQTALPKTAIWVTKSVDISKLKASKAHRDPLAPVSTRVSKPSRLTGGTLSKSFTRAPTTTQNRSDKALSSAKSRRPVRETMQVKEEGVSQSNTESFASALASSHLGHTVPSSGSEIPMLGHLLPPRPGHLAKPSPPHRRIDFAPSPRRRDRTEHFHSYGRSDSHRHCDRSASPHRHEQFSSRRQRDRSDSRRYLGVPDSYRPRGSPPPRRRETALPAPDSSHHDYTLDSQLPSNTSRTDQSELDDGEILEGQGKEDEVAAGLVLEHGVGSPARVQKKLTKATSDSLAAIESSEESVYSNTSEATDDGLVNKKSSEKSGQEPLEPTAEVEEPAAVLSDRDLRKLKMQRLVAGIRAKNEDKEKRKRTMNGY